jgi:hypothetical protein
MRLTIFLILYPFPMLVATVLMEIHQYRNKQFSKT